MLATVAILLGCPDPAAVQPIPFNHRIHVRKVGLTCDNCHSGVRVRASAGIPRVSLCMGCHEGDVTTNPAAGPGIEVLRRHAAAGTDLPWTRLYELPGHVYYSHRRHVAIGGLGCPTCHGAIGDSERPPDRPLAKTIDMDTCMDCHEERGVENDCAWCHR